jgi:transcriptional regulator of acetoin/glycerol metabolism
MNRYCGPGGAWKERIAALASCTTIESWSRCKNVHSLKRASGKAARRLVQKIGARGCVSSSGSTFSRRRLKRLVVAAAIDRWYL